MPAPATIAPRRPDLRPPAGAGRVPVEFIGRARVLRDRIATADARWSAAAEELTAPLRPRGDFAPQFTRKSCALLAARWRNLPEWGRLRCVARNGGARLQILETRLAPFRLAMDGWTEDELAVAVTLHQIEMTLPATFAATTRLIAAIGLHAVGRRYERGGDRRDGAVLCDLSVFGRAWPDVMRSGAGDFAIPALAGGRWIGAVMTADRRLALSVRTFVA